jgi:hypothetical protein
MKSDGPTIAGLVGALEDFAEREAIMLRVGDFAGFAAIRRREAPLIARLCELAAQFDSRELAGRMGALLLRRRQNLSMLQERTAFLRSERQRVAERQERLRVLSPYAQSPASDDGHPSSARKAVRLNASV